MPTEHHAAVPGAPQRVLPSCHAWPLLGVAEARRQEAAALARAPGGSLMAAAGLALARLAVARFPTTQRIEVFCGPGNNGGDGLVAARWLHGLGWAVQCRRFDEGRAAPEDAAEALRAARAAGVRFVPPEAPLQADLLIDALLGLGIRQPPTPAIAAGIALLNRARAQGVPVLAVDLPSGLHPDTGAVLGPEAVRATATLALLALKPGCFTHQGRDHAGEVWLADLGVNDASGAPPTAWLSGPPAPLQRPHDSHKGRFGDVLVLGGAAGMSGAAVLAASAALAAGAGRVHLCRLDGGSVHEGARPELMHLPAAWMQAPPWLASRTVVAGCGGGEAVAAVLPPLLTHAGRLVLDADALNAVATDPGLLAALAARGSRGRPTVLTPHPLEAARLLGTGRDAVQADRLAAAVALAERCRATVLLKGSGSIVASPGQRPVINPTGNAALASAGTGDVLAGWLGGLWAGQPDTAPQVLAAAAAWQHGAAADRHAAQHGAVVLRAGDLIERMAGGCA
jgi:ADP-dependent NAD(P)H-hydrate dehydratase / NAD(P)H-hydrate epimerase